MEFYKIERSAGFDSSRPEFMRNAPTAFFMVYPLGFLGERVGSIIWSLMIIAALMISIRLLWILHGKPSDGIHLIGYCFPPVMACLIAGQVAIFVLFGLVLFFYFRERLPYMAGLALILCALKPHLFLPFGAVLIAWTIIMRKTYLLLAGAASAVVASLACSFYLDPLGWLQYAAMMRDEKLHKEFIPTVSLMFRLAVDRNALWIQFIPAATACIWAIWYFRRNQDHWNWMEHGSLLLLVSVMVAPYAWFSDEAIVLPAILAGLYRLSDDHRSLLPFLLVAGAAFVEVLAGVSLTSGFYVWTSPAWLLWYLFATSAFSPEKHTVPASA